MPFYNGQSAILKMLDSIYSLSLGTKEFEVIIVDDCSPVLAESVLSDYIETHQNITIIRHESNKRQGGAKNTGIRIAMGKYIAFVDQDDVIYFENMHVGLLKAIKYDVDMLACHYTILNEKGQTKGYGLDKGDGEIMTGKDFCENYFVPGYNLAPWAILYKREFLLRVNHPYEENVVMEDSDWIAWHWIHADRVGIFNKPIYMWCMNPNSITHSNSYINRADWIKFGYRKMRDADIYSSISTAFSDIMYNDGYINVVGGMKKLWKVDNYYKFYRHLGATLQELQKMSWRGIAKWFINYPTLSLFCLYSIGSTLKLLNYARCKIIK